MRGNILALLPLIEELKRAKPSPFCEHVLAHADSCRMYKSLVSQEDLEKKRRKVRRIAQVTNKGQLISAEGVWGILELDVWGGGSVT